MFHPQKSLSLKFKRLVAALRTSVKGRDRYQDPRWAHPTASRPEEYVPGYVWDALNPVERYATVGDLCAHLGDQLPIQIVKLVAKGILAGLNNLHTTRGVAHTAISMDCILISPRDMKSLATQFSDGQTQTVSVEASESSFKTRHLDMDTLLASSEASSPVFRLETVENDRPRHDPFAESYALRAPEIILDAPSDTSVDLWSLGCVLYELLTGETLFDPFFQTIELGLSPEESHIIQIIEMLGEFPEDLLLAGKNSHRWFNEKGCFRLDTMYYPVTLEKILRMRIDESEVANATDFLGTLLQLRPQERGRARDLIDHSWLTM